MHAVAERPRAVQDAQRLIDARPGQPWKLPTLARAVGVSPSHLATLFTRSLGTPPHRTLLERRVALAKQWLSATDRPITSIALDVGFSSSQHFARAFRDAEGLSAREYRKRAQS